MSDIKIKRLKRGWIGKKTKLFVTSPFGAMRRLSHYKTARIHHGLDIGIPVGTPIYAPVAGSATVKFNKGGGGLYIQIISNGFCYWFMHLSRSSLGKVGTTKSVTEGQIIGYSGGAKGNPNSGSSTGPHLHFEIRRKPYNASSSSINPIYFMSDELIGKVKQNRMNQEIVTVSMVGETYDGEEEHYVTVSREQLANDLKQDISSEVVDNETEDENVVIDVNIKDGLAAGIWQISKLVMDTDVANLRLRDAATSIQQGSLINFFNKVCQKPFVEFTGDTFGDQYYFLVRKPPFDREGMLKTMTAQGLFNKDGSYMSSEEEYKSPYVIDENDIINSSISMNTQGIYSWYQFFPIYEMGAQSELQYIIPAVLFPEYAAIWGSRDLQIRSQYRNFLNPSLYDDIRNGKKNAEGDTEVRHSIKDLHYIVESNAYAPFVRNGSITIIGNRKIKRGCFVSIKWQSLDTPEIFYVESVSQNYSIANSSVQRTTSLTLSHGMMRDFMFDKNNNVNFIKDKNIQQDKKFNASYFNLINFGNYDKVSNNINMDQWHECISSWKVNIDVFKFFLRKLQFMSRISSNEITNVVGKR